MSWALCLNCGCIKFGARCPCPDCGVVSLSGDDDLDVLLSNQVFSPATLEEFGTTKRKINRASPDREVAFASFLCWFSGHYPQLLTVTFPPRLLVQVEQVLRGLDVPRVAIEDPPELRLTPQEVRDVASYLRSRSNRYTLKLLYVWATLLLGAPIVIPFVLLVLAMRGRRQKPPNEVSIGG